MTKIQTSVDTLQDEYRTNSIINDLEKKSITDTFSEASRRTIKDTGNIEQKRTCRNSQNKSMPIVLEIFQRRDSCLFVW